MENIDLIAKESVVHNIQAVAKCATQAQNLLDLVKQSLYNEKGGKVSSDGVHVKGNLESANKVIQEYSKVVRENIDRRAQINDARKNHAQTKLISNTRVIDLRIKPTKNPNNWLLYKKEDLLNNPSDEEFGIYQNYKRKYNNYFNQRKK